MSGVVLFVGGAASLVTMKGRVKAGALKSLVHNSKLMRVAIATFGNSTYRREHSP